MKKLILPLLVLHLTFNAQAITAAQCFTSLVEMGKSVIGVSTRAPVPITIVPDTSLPRTLEERAEQLKAKGAQRGAELLATVKDGVLEVDAILRGGGVFTSLFAANFNGRMIVIEMTREAGNFDRIGPGVRINSQETPTQSGNPFPGSPATMKDVMAASSDTGGVHPKGKYGNGRELGNTGIEALDYSGAPVWYSTEARPFEIEPDGRVSVMASNGIKVIGKYGLLGGQGPARLDIVNGEPDLFAMLMRGIDPANLVNYRPSSSVDRTREIYESDRQAQSARPRVLTSDEILAARNLPELVDGKTIVVTGDSHGAMSALMKLIGRDPGRTQAKPAKILWIGNSVFEAPTGDRDIYKPVLDGVESGVIVQIQGRVSGTEPGSKPNTVNVRYSTEGIERVQEVDMHVLAIGYTPRDMSFLGATAKALLERQGSMIVMAPLPPMTGIPEMRGDVPVGVNLANVYPLGPLLGQFAPRGFRLPEVINHYRIGTIIDVFGRQAAALGRLLSPNKPQPVSVVPTVYKAQVPAPTASGLRREFAVLDVKKEVGKIIANKQYNISSGNLEVKFVLRNGILEVQAPIANSLEFGNLISNSNFVSTLLNLGSQVTLTIPVVDGQPVIHAMTVGTRS